MGRPSSTDVAVAERELEAVNRNGQGLTSREIAERVNAWNSANARSRPIQDF
jgi:hypothetical protein